MLAGTALLTVGSAVAQETVTYTYDNKGRLVTVNHSGGPSNGVNASYTYDNADNRTNVTFSGVAPPPTCVGVSFAVGNSSANEGSNLSFNVTKSGTTSDTCTVNYATANGTAVSGTNYTAKSGALSFASSTTSQAVTVATIDDHVVTGAVTMKLNLSSPSGSATITTAQGTGTINNIDTGSTNHAPVCATITMNIDHRATTTVHVTSSMILSPCSDADGDTLTVTSPATPYDISVVANGPPITSVNTVSDGHGGSTTQTIQINRT